MLKINLPKETIHNNRAFLADLVNLTSSHQDLPPLQLQIAPPSRPPFRFSTRARIATIFAAVMLSPTAIAANWVITLGGGFFGHFVRPSVADRVPPVETFNVHLVSTTLRSDEALQLSLTQRRDRVCMTTVDRVILAIPTNTYVATERIYGGWQAVTTEPTTRVIAVPLPAGIKPGSYVYRAYVRSDCGGPNEVFDFNHPPLKFEVTG